MRRWGGSNGDGAIFLARSLLVLAGVVAMSATGGYLVLGRGEVAEQHPSSSDPLLIPACPVHACAAPTPSNSAGAASTPPPTVTTSPATITSVPTPVVRVPSRPRGHLVVGLAGKCLDPRGEGTANGTPIQLFECRGVASQFWLLQPDGHLLNPHSGRCLDLAGGRLANGTPAQLYECGDAPSQRWTPRPDGTLVNPPSGKCLDVDGGRDRNGETIQLWSCHGGANQQWGPEPGLVRGQDGRCLQADPSSGSQISARPCDGSLGQQWRLLSAGPLLHPATGRCLTGRWDDEARDYTLYLSRCDDSPDQDFAPRSDGTLVHVRSGTCLDGYYQDSRSGWPRVGLGRCDGTAAQRWTVTAYGW